MPRPREMAKKAAGKAKAAKEGLKGHTGIMRTLAEEHGAVSALMRSCSETDDAARRKELFARIREELLSHTEAEQKIFYARLKQHDETAELAVQGESDHADLKSMMDRLESMSAESDRWAELFDELCTSFDDHVKMEERDMFAIASDVLDASELEDMQQRYTREREKQKQLLH